MTYSRRFDEYSGDDPGISLGRAIDAGNKGVLVESPIRQAQGAPIAVEWLISDRGGKPEIVDLIIEGVSMATTQREEIADDVTAHVNEDGAALELDRWF